MKKEIKKTDTKSLKISVDKKRSTKYEVKETCEPLSTIDPQAEYEGGGSVIINTSLKLVKGHSTEKIK